MHHQEEQVSGVEMEEKRETEDVGTGKGGRNGDSRAGRGSWPVLPQGVFLSLWYALQKQGSVSTKDQVDFSGLDCCLGTS